MFKVVAEPQFTHTVKVRVPVDGGHEDQSFKARFRVVDTAEVGKIELEEGRGAAVKRILVSMDELADADGNPVSYSDALRDQLIQLPYVEIALYRTYLEAVVGAKTGN